MIMLVMKFGQLSRYIVLRALKCLIQIWKKKSILTKQSGQVLRRRNQGYRDIVFGAPKCIDLDLAESEDSVAKVAIWQERGRKS